MYNSKSNPISQRYYSIGSCHAGIVIVYPNAYFLASDGRIVMRLKLN